MTKEKKQVVVIGALGALLVTVGAFQFLGSGGANNEPLPYGDEEISQSTGSGDQAVATQKSEQKTEDELVKARLAELMTAPMSPRDPFRPKASVETVDPSLASGATANVSTGDKRPISPPRTSNSPRPLAGDFTDFQPLQVSPGQLPPALGGTGSGESENRGYKLAGVIVGKKKMAVLEDGSGRQKLVPVGESVDGRTQVVSIEKDKVRIKEDGRIKELGLPEDHH